MPEIVRMSSSTPVRRRVLIIALDGVRPDALQQYAPHLVRFGERSRTTWNSRVAIPISASSWATVFTGLGHKRTGIANNAFTAHSKTKKANRLALQKEDTLFHILGRASLPSLLISTGSWNGVCTIGEYAQQADASSLDIVHIPNVGCTEYQTFVNGCKQMRECIAQTEYACLTLYTSYIDSVGHQHGFCPSPTRPYAKAITRADIQIKRLLQTIDARERTHGEEWMVLIATDHGGSCRRCLQRTPSGRRTLRRFDQNDEIHAGSGQTHDAGIHGIRNDRSIQYQHTRAFVIVRVPRQTGGRIRRRVTNADITPTIVRYLLPESTHERLSRAFDGQPIAWGRTTVKRKDGRRSCSKQGVTSKRKTGGRHFR